MGLLSFKTVDDPNKTSSSASFATYMIVAPTSFFLGMLFSALPYDYPLLWTSEKTTAEMFDRVEAHLLFLHNAPPVVPRILHIVIFVGFSGFFIKLFKPSEANLLFDGASLVLYVVGVIVYIANIVKGLRLVSAGMWDQMALEAVKDGNSEGEMLVGREDSLRVLAASNTILALVLIGVLVLQAGQWYAERKEKDEQAKYEKEQRERAASSPTGTKGSHSTRGSIKKKQ